MKKIIFGLTVLAISLNAHSAPIPPKPNHCPSIQSIRSMGFDIFRDESDGIWSVWKLKMAYDTNATWDLGMGVTAKNANDAATKSKALLAVTTTLDGPELSDDESFWICYDINVSQNGEYSAITTTTPGQFGKSSLIKR
jgi:hypothetical protein